MPAGRSRTIISILRKGFLTGQRPSFCEDGFLGHGSRELTERHIAVVYESNGQASAYLNGQKQQSAPSRFDFVGVHAGIGARYLNQNGNEFLGRMKDFQIRRRALSQEEISKLAKDRP